MKHPDNKLVTPIFVKSEADMPWPEEERAFYVLGANGLFLCRNHPFFRSSTPAPNWPSELSPQRTFLQLRYPKVPRKMFESIVGFFDRIGQLHGSEAGVLLVWDRTYKRMRVVVPEQTATVSRSWRGDVYPIGLHYDYPTDLPADWTIIGDVHSHVDEPAYSSFTDKSDETHRAGLHIVVGRLYRDPPEFHIAAVVDGTRFTVETDLVLDGYEKRRTRVPQAWIDRVQVEPFPKPKPVTYSGGSYGSGWSSYSNGGNSYSGGSYGSGSSYGSSYGKRYESGTSTSSDDGNSSRPKPPREDDDRDAKRGDRA